MKIKKGAGRRLRLAAERLKEQWSKLAFQLQQATERYSVRQKKIGLITFSALCLSISVSCLVKGFQSGVPVPFTIEPIRPIRLPQRTKLPVPDTDAVLRLRNISGYLDSLQATPGGRRTRDSLLRAHPRFYDTLRLLMHLYSQQLK
jgi:hypothetical protein